MLLSPLGWRSIICRFHDIFWTRLWDSPFNRLVWMKGTVFWLIVCLLNLLLAAWILIELPSKCMKCYLNNLILRNFLGVCTYKLVSMVPACSSLRCSKILATIVAWIYNFKFVYFFMSDVCQWLLLHHELSDILLYKVCFGLLMDYCIDKASK